MNENLSSILYQIAKIISEKNPKYDNSYIGSLYEQIKKIYKKFLNEENNRIGISLKEVELCFDLNDYPEEMLEFFQTYLRWQEDTERLFSSKGEKLVNRKFYYNSKKIELDKESKLINKVIDKVNDKSCGRRKIKRFEINEAEYMKVEWIYKNEIMLRSDVINKQHFKEYIDLLAHNIRRFVGDSSDKYGDFYKLGFIGEFYSSEIIVVLYVWGIIKMINSAILLNSKIENKKTFLQNLLDKIKKDISELKKDKMPKKNNVYEAYLEYLMFYVVRAKWCRNIQIIQQLSDEIKDGKYNMEIEARYQVINGEPNFVNLSKTKLMKFILEDDSTKEKIERFTEKYNKCLEFIKELNGRTNRKLSYEDPRTVKAVYREFFVAEGTVGELRAKTIINRYIDKKDFDNIEDYYFIDEKINRGMFREYLLKDEYLLRNEIYGGLYYIALNMLCSFDKCRVKTNAYMVFGKYISYIHSV